MNTKLTLRMDEDLIAQAKAYAAKEGRSVSDLVSVYFARLTDPSKPANASSALKADALLGSNAPRCSAFYGLIAGSRLEESDYRAYLEQKHK
jgi:Family of unknown function (DUF6364)